MAVQDLTLTEEDNYQISDVDGTEITGISNLFEMSYCRENEKNIIESMKELLAYLNLKYGCCVFKYGTCITYHNASYDGIKTYIDWFKFELVNHGQYSDVQDDQLVIAFDTTENNQKQMRIHFPSFFSDKFISYYGVQSKFNRFVEYDETLYVSKIKEVILAL